MLMYTIVGVALVVAGVIQVFLWWEKHKTKRFSMPKYGSVYIESPDEDYGVLKEGMLRKPTPLRDNFQSRVYGDSIFITPPTCATPDEIREYAARFSRE